MAILRSVSPLVEPASLDEAYVDVTEAAARTSARELATSIKQRVKDQVGLTISIGIATSKSVAKIASDFDKPDGLFLVKRGDEAGFLAPLPVRALSGIGPKTQEQLQARGIQTLGQLANQSEDWLHEHFGKRGPELGERSRGIDHRPVTVERVAKSISAEMTFPQDIGDAARLAEQLSRLCSRVGDRIQRHGTGGRTVTLKLRLADFSTFTRSHTVPTPILEAWGIEDVAQRLLNAELAPGRRFRLLGVGVAGFEPVTQPALF